MDLTEQQAYPFDVDLISASESDFYWQMRFIKKYFTPIRLSALCDYMDGKSKLPTNPIVVTFDDGFDDNYHVAFPILRELKIPASIFVTCSFVEEQRTIWYERLAYFIQSQNRQIEIPEIDIALPATDKLQKRKEYYSIVVERFKHIPDKERVLTLDRLYSRYHEDYFSIEPDIRKLSRSVTWEQLKEMSESVFEVGSHSISHPVLTMLADEELDNELVGSKNILEEKLSLQIDTLAYPVGMDFAYNDRVKIACKKAGYKLGLAYNSGRNNPNNLDRYGLLRMHVDRDMPRSTFSSALAVPSVFTD